ncbi:class I adenylate-forming enzyme family protein [Prescottella agglutinans]|uniref:Long-chain acyl-CoA synthetase n=1 Tax=Prescottella agglutinans TaxID=1644129 RepID=A0ABT6ML11_9NOCA|nr:AMP-binding protein [Prescottella agglutinans]MDH6285012.1 long-chain acyl-CoA synthetase [Prescottella agglutinans]
MTPSANHPWTSLYTNTSSESNAPEFGSVLDAFRRNAEEYPDSRLVTYFDSVLTFGDVDRLSDAFAVALSERGVRQGDRVAIYMQSCPQYIVCLLAAWKIGAVHVPMNPMLRESELRYHLDDCGALVLVALDSLWEESGRRAVDSTNVQSVITTSAQDMQTRNDIRLFSDARRHTMHDSEDMVELLRSFDGRQPKPFTPEPDDIAFLCYTSGTTGKPKGSMSTHRNVVVLSQVVRDVFELGPASTVLGLAPMFHITGLVVQFAPCLLSRSAVVLTHRFHPDVMLDSIREYRPTHAVGAITAFVALTQATGSTREDWSSFTRIYSGGAPVSPATATAFERFTGHQLLGAYGMTEATGATCLGPAGMSAPVDPSTGALAVGIPIPGTTIRIVDDAGTEVPSGTPGEVVFEGPGVCAGYWNRPEATAETIRSGQLYSGDIGVMNEGGWVFLVDRKKDLINCSGFKVWPREVEDALYENPAVREAAVVGVPDPYRGETVKAFVSIAPGHTATPESLRDFLADRLAAYKRPAVIEILSDLPKTASGKILRRALRPDPQGLPSAELNTTRR